MNFKLLLLAVFISITLLAQPVKKYGRLKVEGTQLVSESGEPVVLRGISYGWHNWWPRFYNEGTVNHLVNDWKATVLRAAVGVTDHSDSSYIKNPEFTLKKIIAVVDAAIKNDVYVIIDWHSHEIHLKEAKEFFDLMSKKYNKYPNIIYEVFNEPVEDSWEDVKNYAIEVIKTIRSNDSNNIILVGSPHWDQDVHIVADSPIEGFKNIMYTLHYYAGTHKDYLRERGDYALSKGIPLFISESAGMKANGDGAIDMDEWQKWIDWSEANKISWVTWSIADKNETCSMLYESADSEGNWKDEDIKKSGKLIREKLLKFFESK